MIFSKYWARVCRIMPDSIYIKWQYWHTYHKKLNIKCPKTYAEKLAYLKLYEKDERLCKLVDKYEVRQYVAGVIGEDYLVPLLGIYDDSKDIDWDKLPEKYVLKCTHDSGSTILHPSDEGFNKRSATDFLNSKLSRNLFWASREYPYKNIKPRIVCEHMLLQDGHVPYDYKILCFSGSPKYIIVDMDRFGNHHRDCYDINWNKLDFGTDHEQGIEIQPRPENLEKMLELAGKLSEGFKHVRVDFYSLGSDIYFGELTFFPWGGCIWFEPEEWNYILGEMIPIKN